MIFRSVPASSFWGCCASLLIALAAFAGEGNGSVRKVRLVQDDAQDYMVSKIYPLKYVQANDLIPFVSGIVMRYNMNSSVNSIEYGDNTQWLTVTCPVKMMPYVDDFVAKADRNIKVDGRTPGDLIRGTGITRAVYRPKYRSGQAMLDVLVNSVIGEGPCSSVYAWDANSNQIYWKDNSSNTSYVYQFLGFLDRPAPQVTIHFTLYEIRESTLRDIGVEYLAWKNGPGMNLLQTGWRVFSLSSAGSAALQAASGPLGGFCFAPQFDASFIRLLAQKGCAEVTNSAAMTVTNSNTQSYEIFFDPELQNIIKRDNDAMSVETSALSLPVNFHQVYAKITAPVVNIHYGTPQAGYPGNEAFEVNDYTPGILSGLPGTLFFSYLLQSANVVERNNVGDQLVETCEISGSVLIPLDREMILGRWEKEMSVTQWIGAPWLSEIPVLRYLFGTETRVREYSRVYVTVKAHLLDAGHPAAFPPGVLKAIK